MTTLSCAGSTCHSGVICAYPKEQRGAERVDERHTDVLVSTVIALAQQASREMHALRNGADNEHDNKDDIDNDDVHAPRGTLSPCLKRPRERPQLGSGRIFSFYRL